MILVCDDDSKTTGGGLVGGKELDFPGIRDSGDQNPLPIEIAAERLHSLDSQGNAASDCFAASGQCAGFHAAEATVQSEETRSHHRRPKAQKPKSAEASRAVDTKALAAAVGAVAVGACGGAAAAVAGVQAAGFSTGGIVGSSLASSAMSWDRLHQYGRGAAVHRRHRDHDDRGSPLLLRGGGSWSWRGWDRRLHAGITASQGPPTQPSLNRVIRPPGNRAARARCLGTYWISATRAAAARHDPLD